MMHLIRSEIRKYFTVRSTYLLLGIGLALSAFVSFYFLGYRMTEMDTMNPMFFSGVIAIVVSNLILFTAIVSSLAMTHEYRYNTIMYTLTSSNSRFKVLIAKLLVVSAFATLATLLMAGIAFGMSYLGLQVKGLPMGPQDYPGLYLLYRVAFFGWAYSMFALIIAFILRNPIGAIVALIFVPGPIEGLMSIWLKGNAVYQPFTALTSVLQPTTLTHAKAMWIVLGYIVVGWIVAAILFKKRDAN